MNKPVACSRGGNGERLLAEREPHLLGIARIRRLSLGSFGDVRPVGAAVSELRVDCGPGYRIYFQQRAGQLVLLLVGGDKRSQVRDIAKAKELALTI
ncbi:MAG: type II toxin-antitoxin system RelE/ParE family toxin [Deltaproteobacteria bacterium]|nr:type II toxin-antitoxin system RelE/ParE family toxin [Deltaproteobacteria bacterium]